MQKPQKVLIVGATGGSGRAAIEELLSAGHYVTAFSRHADRLARISDAVAIFNGDGYKPIALSWMPSGFFGQDQRVRAPGVVERRTRVWASRQDKSITSTRQVFLSSSAFSHFNVFDVFM